jgi:phosphinothricin acetyltransferase
MIEIRAATPDDAERLLEIYRHYVLNTAISFEYNAPDLEEFRARIVKTLQKYPYLVAEQEGVILGYAYAGPFVGRKAYDWSAETTVYVSKDVRQRGIGGRLYSALEDALKKMGILNLYARIGYTETDDEYLTKNSAQFHEHMGYALVGTFHKCGYKFDRWYDMICMEKIIGTHEANQSKVKPFAESDGINRSNL